MKTHTRLVWLAYLSIVLSMVWGVPGLLLSWYVLKTARGIDVSSAPPNVRRDVRGARVIAYVGMTMSSIVVVLVLWSWVTT